MKKKVETPEKELAHYETGEKSFKEMLEVMLQNASPEEADAAVKKVVLDDLYEIVKDQKYVDRAITVCERDKQFEDAGLIALRHARRLQVRFDPEEKTYTDYVRRAVVNYAKVFSLPGIVKTIRKQSFCLESNRALDIILNELEEQGKSNAALDLIRSIDQDYLPRHQCKELEDRKAKYAKLAKLFP